MSEETEDRLRDWVIWYKEHEKQIPRDNLAKKLEFMEKAVDGVLELLVMTAKDVQELEKRNGRGSLWLPGSVKIDGGPPVRLR